MNVVIIVADALRARNLGCYGYDKTTSPEIDAIAQRGARFANAFSTVNCTDPSFTTLFTGKYPLSHGLKGHGERVTEEEKSYTASMRFLAEVLRESGLVTIGIDWLGRWHRKGYDYYSGLPNKACAADEEQVEMRTGARGQRQVNAEGRFEYRARRHYGGNWYYALPDPLRRQVGRSFLFWNQKLSGGLSQWKKRPMLTDSAALSELAMQYIRQYAGKRDLFLFVHFWDTHIPYTAPHRYARELLARYGYPTAKVSTVLQELEDKRAQILIWKATRGRLPETIGQIMASYDAAIRYVDEHVGRIYRSLEEARVLEDTLFIFTSDHGESLGEHRVYFDHHCLYDPQIHVPLIVCHPSVPAGVTYQDIVQHYDIMPTVLDATGIGDIGVKFDGQSLLRLVRGDGWGRRFAFAEEFLHQRKRMIRDQRYKYIQALNDLPCRICEVYHGNSAGDEFYDLERDPEEHNNIIGDPRSTIYRTQMERFADSVEKPVAGGKVTFADEDEVTRRLEALGYM